jgi:hypothetical protein
MEIPGEAQGEIGDRLVIIGGYKATRHITASPPIITSLSPISPCASPGICPYSTAPAKRSRSDIRKSPPMGCHACGVLKYES